MNGSNYAHDTMQSDYAVLDGMSYFWDIVLNAQLSAIVLHFYFAPRIKSKDRADIRQQRVQQCLCYLGKALRNNQSEGKHRIAVNRFMDKSSESLRTTCSA